MYIPKFRTAEDVVGFFRERDPKSVVSCGLCYRLMDEGLVAGFEVGRKRVLNLDEVLFYLSGAAGYATPTTQEPLIVTAKTAHKLLKEKDPATKLSRDCLRDIVVSGAIQTFTACGHLHFDFNALMAYLSPRCFAASPKKIPRLRTYENTYHRLQKYTKLKCTWNALHQICHSGNVFCLHYGNRWIVNYDEIKHQLQIASVL